MLYEALHETARQRARYHARRRVTARARRREHGAQEPAAAKLRYAAALRRVFRSAWVLAIRDSEFPQAFKEAASHPNPAWPSAGRQDARGGLRVQVLEHVREGAVGAADRAARDVSGHNARAQRRLVGIDPRVDPGTGPVIDAFRQQNVQLVTNLAEEMLQRVEAISRDYLAGRVEDLADELQKSLGWTEARAQLVARDQTLKLNGQLTRVRQQNAGIEEYVWTTSGDERVRDTHAAKDGKRFRWDNPPQDTGHPGEDYQCRCTAYPVIPGLDEEQAED